jgi:ribonuclease D
VTVRKNGLMFGQKKIYLQMTSVFPPNISPELIAELPLRQFGGRIVLVDTIETLHEALKMLGGHTVLGFDTETKPSFKKGQINKVSMLQLSYHDTCFIIRLNKVGLCDELVHLLSSTSIIKVGLSIRDDFRELSKLRHFHPAGFIDLQSYVEDFGVTDKSLKKLSALIMGYRISKSQQTSNWEAEHLSEAQLIYAATDAWVCLEIYRKLKEIEARFKQI